MLRISSRFCCAGSLLAVVLAPATSADLLDPVSQERFVSGSAYAENYSTSESDSDSDSATASDFGLFNEARSATAEITDAYSSGGGWQNSVITSVGIDAAGSSFANAEAYDWDTWSDASGRSKCSVVFDVDVQCDFVLDVYLAAYDDGFVSVTFNGPAGAVVWIDEPYNNEVTTVETGTLDPGEHTLTLDATSSAYGDPFTYGYGFSEYDIQLSLTSAGCPADITGDEQVNIDDIFAVLGLWGNCPAPCPPYCTGDLTEDCTVNIDDIFAILGQWGPCE